MNLRLNEKMASMLETLSPREESIMRMRLFAVTRERFRQIEAKALRKLHHSSRSHLVRTFLEGLR